MHKIIFKNKIFFVGKVKHLLEALETTTKDFTTVKELIDYELNQ